MPRQETKNVVATLPIDTYNKLRFIADTMGVSMPNLMGQILSNEFFISSVDSLFETVSQITKVKQ